MKSLQTNEKICRKCGLLKSAVEFRKNKNICRLCEKIYDQQRCSGDRVCTNCQTLKLEDEFDKYSRHCKECKSNKNREKLVGLRNAVDQTNYELHLKRNSQNNVKRFQKKNKKFDLTPIEECYEDYLNILRKNANSRATKSKIACDIDLPFLIDLYNKQNGKCALTKITFKLNRHGTKRAFAPSIDRLNCGGGYTRDNVRLVCLVVNLALNDFGDEVFDIMCQGYVKNATSA